MHAGYRGLGNQFDDDLGGIGLPSLPTSVTGASSCQIDSELGLVSFLPPRTRNINWHCEKSLPCEQPLLSSYQYSPEVQKAIESILYIADHIKKEDDDNNVRSVTVLQRRQRSNFDISIHFFRLSKTGSTWQWFLTVCSYGSLP